MKKIVLLLTFLLNGYTIAGNNDDEGTNSSTPTLPSNYDSGGSYHTAAVLTVLQEYSDYTTVNGWWSDAQYRHQIQFTMNQGDVTSMSLVYHIGTSAPALTEAKYAMRSGQTNIDEIGNAGFPTFYNGDGGSGTSWAKAFQSGQTYTIWYYTSNMESTIGNNDSNYNTAAKREGNRIYFALLYYDSGDDEWELDPLTDNAYTSGSDPAYVIFDEVATNISDIKRPDGTSYSDCNCSYTNYTYGIPSANFTYDLDGTISSSIVKYTRTYGSGSSTITKTDLLEQTSSGSDHDSRDWDGAGELTDGDFYDIYFEVTDAAGNRDWLSTYDDIKYDKTAATVTGVHSEETANSTFTQGEVVDFYVQFSEKVDFSSVATIILKTNTAGDALATINCDNCNGTESDKLYFNWSVPDGAYSKYLDYSATNALSGTIKDNAGNSATLTLPTPATWGQVGSTNTPNSLASTSNASGGYITVDGDDPTGFSIASITPVGGNVVPNYINGTNTGQRIVVTLPDDETIVGGKLLIEGNYNSGGWGSLNSATGWTISSGEVTALKKEDADVSVTGGSFDLDDLTGWASSNQVQYRVTVTDANSNAGTAVTYATQSTVDLHKPKVSSVTGAAANTTARTLKSGDSETFELNIVDTNSGSSESVTFKDGGNDPYLKLETGDNDAVPTLTSPAADASATKLKFAYTAADGETTVANTDGKLITHASSPLSVEGGTIRDAAGNDLDTDISGLSSANSLINANIKVDAVLPEKIVLDSIIVSASGAGDTTVQAYWNQYSDLLSFYMAIPATGTDPTLTGGNIQLKVDFDGSYVNLGSTTSIGSGDQGNTKFKIEMNATTFEGATGWTNGDQAKFKAVITDVAGNSTTGDQASTTITIDETSPADVTIADTTTAGAPVIDGYWNVHNTSVDVKANIPADGSGSGMIGGKLQIQAKISDSGATNWADIGSPKLNLTSSGDVQTITITKASLSGHTGYEDGATITYRAVIWDKAGNKTLGSAYANTQVVDITAPTVAKIFASTPSKILNSDESHNIVVRMSSNPTIVGTPTIEFKTNNTPGTGLGVGSYASVSTTDMTFAYPVDVDEFALQADGYLDVTSDDPITLPTGSTIRDVAGNAANLDFSGLSTANKLPASLVEVDGVAPVLKTTENVIANGVNATIRSGYYNSTNDSVTIKVPLTDTDQTLDDGKVEAYFKLSTDNDFDYTKQVGDDQTIATSDRNQGYKYVYVTKSQLNSGGKNYIADNEGKTLEITVKVFDKAGNSIAYTKSASKLIVDTTAPTAKTIGAITTVGGNVVSDYWNSTNESVNVIVSLDASNDATLSNGEIVLQASSNNGGNWTDLRQLVSGVESDTLDIGTASATKTIIVDTSYSTNGKYGIDNFPVAISSTLSDNSKIYFRAAVLDVAGNKTLWPQSTAFLTAKQTLPTISMVTSYKDDKAYKENDILRILVVALSNNTLGVTEKLYVTGSKPILTLETGTNDALVSEVTRATEDDTLWFDYTVAAGHTTSDLSTTLLTVGAGSKVLDAYGNPLNPAIPDNDNAKSLIKKKDIVIDTTPPSVRFTYDDADSLVNFEDKTLIITATFSDSVTTDSIPKLSVDFPAQGVIGTAGANGTATTGDITNKSMISASANGKTFTYNLPLVDNSDGTIKVTMNAYDKALNPITADSTLDGNIVNIDNLDPEAFLTGSVTIFGDTVSGSWFNKATDSLKTVLPINSDDNSLLRGNVQIQMQVDGKMSSDAWVTILPKDTVLALANPVPKYRTKKEILDILTPQKLAQGDSVFIRALINDQVGNETIGTKSTSFFILDTIPPAVGTIVDLAHVTDTTLNTIKGVSTFLTTLRDTLWTNDTLRFGTRNWNDPRLDTEIAASGMQRYEYEILQSPDNDPSKTFTTFRSYQFQTDTLDTVIVAIDSLIHNRNYKLNLRAYDVAGNVSATIVTNSVLRYNARPIGEAIADVVVKEDILWEKRWKVTDKDLSVRDADDKHIGGTLLSDKFTFALTTMKIDTTKTPIDSTVVTVDGKAAVNTSGEVSFTPTKLDTAKYVFRVIVTDQWTLKDTVDINITAIPVNDPPILNLNPIINTWAGKKLTFIEGDSSEHINLTRYAYDEDNDTTSLKYAFKIASTIPANIGYPIAKLGFLSDFGNEYKKSFINKLIDEFPASTIVQKNNSFLIYSGNIDEFKDPIKVDSLRTSDSLFTWIMPTDTTSLDTNYYTESEMLVEFSVIDPEGLIGKDTVTFVINPINDKPVWTGIRDTVVKENDSLLIDFANYLYDVDDSTLTITIEPKTFATNVTLDSSKMSAEAAKTFVPTNTSYQFQSQARKDTVKIKPQPLWFDYENGKPRKGLWNPLDTLSNQIKFVITAADDEGASATDSFIVKVQRVPRPEIRMYVVQNNAFTNYYEVFLVDSLGKTKDITLEVQSTAVTLDTAAAYTYVGHYNFPTEGNYIFEVSAKGFVGDTVITKPVALSLAKMYGRWSGKSVDGQFQVVGQNGSVDFDQSIMILDSTLFEPYFNDRASYLLGNESYRFKKSVEISLPGEQETAIYSRSIGSGWVELPSITEGSRVLAYTEKMGYFRIGPKTLIVPGQTSLQQNYPNPFNPATTIEYDLGFVDGPYQKVNITVYDILGRKIKLLVNEEQSIGRYQVRWNGKDQNGVPVSSGIYFVNLLTDMGRSKTKKVMLMR